MEWSTSQQPIHVHVETPAPPAKQGTNGMAVASLVLSLFWMCGLGSILAIIFGAVGRKQVRESEQAKPKLASALVDATRRFLRARKGRRVRAVGGTTADGGGHGAGRRHQASIRIPGSIGAIASSF